MTKYAVALKGPSNAVERTNQRLKNVHGGDTSIEALMNFIKETVHNLRKLAIEEGKVVIEAAEDAIMSIIDYLNNIVHSRYHQRVKVCAEACA